MGGRYLKMPLDINMFRADKGGDPEIIRDSQRRRFAPPEMVDEVSRMDCTRTTLFSNWCIKYVGVKLHAWPHIGVSWRAVWRHSGYDRAKVCAW